MTTRMLWSGADEMAETSDTGTILRRFVPDGAGAMDGRLATVAASGTVAWHHTDRQGSVVAASGPSGQATRTTAYSPYGRIAAGTTPAGEPFGYTGRQFDPETGLWQYRARYYSPPLGQFLSTDPIGSADDPNLTMYVANDPVNSVDPWGLWGKPGESCVEGTPGCGTDPTEFDPIIIDWSFENSWNLGRISRLPHIDGIGGFVRRVGSEFCSAVADRPAGETYYGDLALSAVPGGGLQWGYAATATVQPDGSVSVTITEYANLAVGLNIFAGVSAGRTFGPPDIEASLSRPTARVRGAIGGGAEADVGWNDGPEFNSGGLVIGGGSPVSISRTTETTTRTVEVFTLCRGGR